MMTGAKPKTVVLLVMIWQRTGGLEAVTMDIAQAFQTLGWCVKVISLFDDKPFQRLEGIEVKTLFPKGRIQRLLWRRLLWRFVSAWHLHRVLSDGGLLLCAHAHLLPALGYVPRRTNECRWGWVHGVDVWGGEAIRWAPFLNRLDRVISVSSFTATEVVRGGFKRALSIVPNSVDVGIFTPTSTPELIRRDEILICGRMAAQERYKGHEVLFQSLSVAERLLERPLSIRVVGMGDDQTRLEKVALELGISDRVKFVGWASMEELVEAYRHCGVFCMPSRLDRPDHGYWKGEGFGLVYIEAAACGRPVIAGADGGSPETIIPGVTGLLVDPLSPHMIAHAIAEVLSNPQQADEMGRQGRLLTQTRFSHAQFLTNLRELIYLDQGNGD